MVDLIADSVVRAGPAALAAVFGRLAAALAARPSSAAADSGPALRVLEAIVVARDSATVGRGPGAALLWPRAIATKLCAALDSLARPNLSENSDSQCDEDDSDVAALAASLLKRITA